MQPKLVKSILKLLVAFNFWALVDIEMAQATELSPQKIPKAVSLGSHPNDLGKVEEGRDAKFQPSLNSNSENRQLKQLEGTSQFKMKNWALDKKILQQTKSLSGGTHGGGGGGGVAKLIAESHLENPIYSDLYVYDFYEWVRGDVNKWNSLITPNSGETSVNYLFRALSRWKGVSPHFHSTLDKHVREVVAQLSHCAVFNGYLDDRGRYAKNEDQWVKDQGFEFVQLALRIPGEKNERGQNYKIYFNCELYKQLGKKNGPPEIKIINQAFLILHEALYLMAAKLESHITSLSTRQLVGYLMSQYFDLNKINFRYWLRNYGFDDFFKLIEDSRYANDTLKNSRQNSYSNVIKTVSSLRRRFFSITTPSEDTPWRDALDFTNPVNPPNNISSYKLKQPIIHNRFEFAPLVYQNTRIALISEVIPQLKDEEAFVYWASLLADFNQDLDFESLFVSNLNDQILSQKICKSMVGFTQDYDIFQALFNKVQRYCSGLGL